MYLDAITLYHIRMPLRAAFETSTGRILEREAILVRVESDSLEGWGECVAGSAPDYSHETIGTAWHVLRDFLIPASLRHDWKGPEEASGLFGWIRGHPMAKAGLEMALWDLWGKRQGRSLASLLGAERERVPVGVSIGIQADTEALLRAVEHFVAQGYRRVKLKIKPGRDLQEVRAVREAFPELPLQVDANAAYSLEDAPVFEAMEELNLLLIEQPLNEDDLLEHARLQARLRTPVCLDESIKSARHARWALELGSCRVINIKAGRVGGLTEARRIHDWARARGVPVWCGGMLETGLGRAANLALAALPGFTLPGDLSASSRYYEEDLIAEPFELEPDGTMRLPQGPGLGVSVRLDRLLRYQVRAERLRR
ncbi:MAG: o-succinylbenzoate synthase [Bacteroidetes bacterium]|nr:o-succinylbenzoate synthase [Rhodothermia bacterium]MCS7155561.1 o-succinylbenzoate synthase [Bacteroidota bacterium]MCX7906419.1 o-succinylbenzoate synthase [Bacteroidota bacterium]MDW8137299.1 o-succinylbenzoate synthase [Bacteroidota bacterium]MDW8284831.1 o-succinylbenzoate synthase [Bacteroidota bacterium]